MPRPPGALGAAEVKVAHVVLALYLAGERRTMGDVGYLAGLSASDTQVAVDRLKARGLLFMPARQGAGGQLRPTFRCHVPLTAQQQRRNRLDFLKAQREAHRG